MGHDFEISEEDMELCRQEALKKRVEADSREMGLQLDKESTMEATW